MWVITNWSALNIDIDKNTLHEAKNGRLENLFYVEDFGFTAPDMEELRNGIVPVAMYRQILDALSSSYNDNATDPESYLYTENLDPDDFIFGFKTPDKLMAEVGGWLPDIKRNFKDCLDRVYTPGMDPDKLKEDTSETYNLQKAARALDNSWHSYSEWGAYLENSCGYPYFTVFPDPGQMREIYEHPEEFVLVDIHVKS